jgi:glucose 1-dehydrogenase
MRLKDKVAIVTGAATGIGEGIARCFSREGAAVTIDYLHGQDDIVHALAKDLRDAGGRALAVAADVTQPAQVEGLIQRTVQEFGKLDIFVNNAGIERKIAFLDYPLEVYQKVLTVNLQGPFICAQLAARQMVAQGAGGRIINISSVHEDLPMPTNAPYCAAKGGLRMLTRTICVELAPHKITVNNIGPGAVDTPLDGDIKAKPELFNQLLDEIPLHRMGQPEEIGMLAVYLASDEAAYVTGSTFFIDGGMLRQSGSL